MANSNIPTSQQRVQQLKDIAEAVGALMEQTPNPAGASTGVPIPVQTGTPTGGQAS